MLMNPQSFFPRARVRFIRYEGTEEKFGAEMNVIKDVTFEGRILEQIQKAVDYIQTQIKERTYLTSGGVFTTEQEYPEFVRTELIVNAVTHRDYSERPFCPKFAYRGISEGLQVRERFWGRR